MLSVTWPGLTACSKFLDWAAIRASDVDKSRLNFGLSVIKRHLLHNQSSSEFLYYLGRHLTSNYMKQREY